MRCKHLLLLRFHWSLLEWLGGDRQLHPEIFGSHLNRLESLTLMILDRKTKGGTSACLASFPPTSMGLRSCLPHFHFVGRTNLASLFLKEVVSSVRGLRLVPLQGPKGLPLPIRLFLLGVVNSQDHLHWDESRCVCFLLSYRLPPLLGLVAPVLILRDHRPWLCSGPRLQLIDPFKKIFLFNDIVKWSK